MRIAIEVGMREIFYRREGHDEEDGNRYGPSAFRPIVMVSNAASGETH